MADTPRKALPLKSDPHTYTHQGKTYDVFKLWELAKGLPTQYLSKDAPDIKDYMKATNWAGGKTPEQILSERDDVHGHMSRIESADLRHPIIMAPNFGIADGLHRIAKAVDKGKDLIRYKKFESWEEMEPALIKDASFVIRDDKEDSMKKDAATKDQRQAELEAWQRWKQDRNAEDFKFLLDSFRPLIYSQGRRYLETAQIPRSAVEADMIQNFHRALETYDPTRGTQLNTHIWPHLKHTGRLLRTYTNIGKIPEPRAGHIGQFEARQAILEESLGRIPTTMELADDMGLSQKEVGLLRKELRRDILTEEAHEGVPGVAQETPRALEQMQFLHMELNPEQQLVLEHTYGMHGRPSVDNNEDLARILGMTPQKVRAIKRQIAKRYEKRYL